MMFEEARRTLREIVEDNGEAPNTLVPTQALMDILGGFDNDEQVMFAHNIAATLLFRLGGEAELQPEEALEAHRTRSVQFSRSPAGTMLLKVATRPNRSQESERGKNRWRASSTCRPISVAVRWQHAGGQYRSAEHRRAD